MEALECIKTRKSIRHFKSDKISTEIIKTLIETANTAPSWKNAQTTRYTAVCNEEIIKNIADNAMPFFNAKTLNQSPLVIAVSTKKGISGFESDGTPTTIYGEAYTYFDAGIACENLCLAANAMGIGSVILGIYNSEKVKKILEIPDEDDLIAIVAFGYPEGEARSTKRKPIEEILRII